MRPHGSTISPKDCGPFANVGWGYRSPDEYRQAVVECIVDGLGQRQYVALVGDNSRTLVSELTQATGGAELTILRVEDFYDFAGDATINPLASVARRVADVERAVTSGYTGLRVIVDATPVARTPAQRDAFASFELLLDQEIASLPVSRICAYDLNVLGEKAATELICLHPFTGPASIAYRVFASAPGQWALDGELDMSNREAFERTARRLLALSTGEIRLDLRHLTFVEHQALVALDRLSGNMGRGVMLINCNPVVIKEVQLLALEHLCVEPA